MSRFISLVVVFQYCMQPSIWKFLNFDCSWHLIFPTNNDFVVNHNVFNSIFRQKRRKILLYVWLEEFLREKFSHKVNSWSSNDSFDHFFAVISTFFFYFFSLLTKIKENMLDFLSKSFWLSLNLYFDEVKFLQHIVWWSEIPVGHLSLLSSDNLLWLPLIG